MTARRPLAAGRRLRAELAHLHRGARRAMSGPGPERDTAVQSCKAAGAAVAAWALTGWWLRAPLAMLAPWTALTLVEATVYRSFRSGLQQLAVIMAGTLWATAAMAATGGSTLGAMLIALPVMVLFGSHHQFGTQGLYGATTALFVITDGAYSPFEVGHRLLETLIGAALGIAVNAFVLPPVRLRDVRAQLHRMPFDSAELLHAMAGALAGEWSASDAAAWHDRARRLARIPDAVAAARRWTAESSRANPGARMRRTGTAPPAVEHDARWEKIAVHLGTVTRTLDCTTGERARLTVPRPAFLARYAELVERAAVLCEAEARLLRAGADPGPPHGPDPGEGSRTEPVPGHPMASDRLGRARDEAWRIHDRLAADFAERPGPAAAVPGELLVESTQLLSVLAPRDAARPDDDPTAADDPEAAAVPAAAGTEGSPPS
ncbi:aromatic acid exporter family protein [Streptomyces sp. TS71-3]|uniref:FUSC family protein n=1 Tax=Streptomyces sp. TS71-3 TaxID=2733862 RepID=UPI001B021EBF|nr:hypothetical protein [Streptomyces sp. TS71-3]GHJ35654.1 hypothetical protein Sm713_12630 [Streptomyces sp. TS71-3]